MLKNPQKTILPAVILPAVLAAAAVTVVLSTSVQAEETWLCSIASAVAVDEDGTVGPPDLGERERPTFFRVNAATKELTLLAPASRRGEVTKIEMVHEGEGVRLFSGVEHGRGLNLIITDAGHMTMSIVSDGAVWSVFGHALPGDVPPSDEQTAADDVLDESPSSEEQPKEPVAAEAGPEDSPS